jgi:hypothetical protein
MKIKGIITNKYIDERNHATKMITIKEVNLEYNIPYSDRYSDGFWNYISIGDSICKEKNSLSIQIIKERSAVNFDFNCKF